MEIGANSSMIGLAFSGDSSWLAVRGPHEVLMWPLGDDADAPQEEWVPFNTHDIGRPIGVLASCRAFHGIIEVGVRFICRQVLGGQSLSVRGSMGVAKRVIRTFATRARLCLTFTLSATPAVGNAADDAIQCRRDLDSRCPYRISCKSHQVMCWRCRRRGKAWPLAFLCWRGADVPFAAFRVKQAPGSALRRR